MILADYPRPWTVVQIAGGRYAIIASNGAQVLRQSPAVSLTERDAWEVCELVNGQQAAAPGSDRPQSEGSGSW